MSDPRAEALREAAENVVSEYRKTHLMHDVAYENVADSIDALALALPTEPALDVERLGLSDEQTAILRKHLASRQQTVSEFLGDVLMEYGLGRATGKDYPPPTAEYAKLSQREDG